MKTFLTAGILFAAFTMASPAQDDKEYQTWMKTVGGTMGPLKKSIDAKSSADTVAGAKKLEAVFSQVEAFWVKRTGDDAIKAAREAQAAAKEIASTAEAGGDALPAFGKLGAACKTCHAAHRDKAADGSWTIK